MQHATAPLPPKLVQPKPAIPPIGIPSSIATDRTMNKNVFADSTDSLNPTTPTSPESSKQKDESSLLIAQLRAKLQKSEDKLERLKVMFM